MGIVSGSSQCLLSGIELLVSVGEEQGVGSTIPSTEIISCSSNATN